MEARSPTSEQPTRWTARADSIAGVEAELSRIWASAADAADDAAMTDNQRALALADPRIGPRLDDRDEDVRVRTRTSVLTLVVVAHRPETVERVLDAINLLNTRHPSRAIIVAPGDPDGPPTIDARIFAACQLNEGSGSETCTEQILLRTGGEIAWHLAGVVTPLLIHDLPVVLWWPDDPPIGQRPFRDLVETCDRLLVDSGTFGQDGGRKLAALASVVAAGGAVVHDIGWMRLTLWRELLAGLFDHPLLMRELRSVRSVRIDVTRPGDAFRTAKAACFMGWLAAMLDWEIVSPLEANRSDTLLGAFRDGRRDIRVEIRPVSSAVDSSIRSAGSLVRVELECGRRGAEVRARVTRQADHLLATAEWGGAQVSRRAGKLEPFGEAPFVAEALDTTGQDAIFEASLARATRLIGG